MPAGGVVKPDGRPPQAKGVGKTARRHDLEAPATPGITGTDLQDGEVLACRTVGEVEFVGWLKRIDKAVCVLLNTSNWGVKNASDSTEEALLCFDL